MTLEDILPEGDTDKLLIDCRYCNQHTMVHLHFNKKYDWSMYQCADKKCDKTWLMDWADKTNWFNEQHKLYKK